METNNVPPFAVSEEAQAEIARVAALKEMNQVVLLEIGSGDKLLQRIVLVGVRKNPENVTSITVDSSPLILLVKGDVSQLHGRELCFERRQDVPNGGFILRKAFKFVG